MRSRQGAVRLGRPLVRLVDSMIAGVVVRVDPHTATTFAAGSLSLGYLARRRVSRSSHDGDFPARIALPGPLVPSLC